VEEEESSHAVSNPILAPAVSPWLISRFCFYTLFFWGDATLTAVYTINRLPTPVTHNQTPFERLYGSSPDYSYLLSLL